MSLVGFEIGPVTTSMVMECVARHYRVPIDRMQANCRMAHLVLPRHVALYLCYRLTKASTVQIGRNFGYRDHTVTLYAVRKIEKQEIEDAEMSATIELLREQIELLALTVAA